MPLFGGSKRTVTASEYARWFHTMDSATDELMASLVPAAFATSIRDLVAQSDPRFASVDIDLFTREVGALRGEIFGLAWGHAFVGKDNHLIAEGVVAKEILTSQGLWELGTKYNKAAARSLEAALPSGERSRAAAAMFQNTFKFEVAKKWDKRGVPPEVIGRVLNRFFSEEPWKSGAALWHLELALVTAVGFVDQENDELNVNEGALIALQVPLLDIYQGSRENLAKYNIKAD